MLEHRPRDVVGIRVGKSLERVPIEQSTATFTDQCCERQDRTKELEIVCDLPIANALRRLLRIRSLLRTWSQFARSSESDEPIPVAELEIRGDLVYAET